MKPTALRRVVERAGPMPKTARYLLEFLCARCRTDGTVPGHIKDDAIAAWAGCSTGAISKAKKVLVARGVLEVGAGSQGNIHGCSYRVLIPSVLIDADEPELPIRRRAVTAATGTRGSAVPVMNAAGLTDPVARKLYAEIHHNSGPVLRQDFAYRSGVSVRTVGRLLADLQARGLIRPVALNDPHLGISGYGNLRGYEATS